MPVVVWQNWDAATELVCIGVSCIIDQHHVLRVSVYYAKVFYVHALGGEIAVLAEESVVHPFVLWVEVVDYNVCVAGMACREEDYLEVFGEVSQ